MCTFSLVLSCSVFGYWSDIRRFRVVCFAGVKMVLSCCLFYHLSMIVFLLSTPPTTTTLVCWEFMMLLNIVACWITLSKKHPKSNSNSNSTTVRTVHNTNLQYIEKTGSQIQRPMREVKTKIMRAQKWKTQIPSTRTKANKEITQQNSKRKEKKILSDNRNSNCNVILNWIWLGCFLLRVIQHTTILSNNTNSQQTKGGGDVTTDLKSAKRTTQNRRDSKSNQSIADTPNNFTAKRISLQKSRRSKSTQQKYTKENVHNHNQQTQISSDTQSTKRLPHSIQCPVSSTYTSNQAVPHVSKSNCTVSLP